MVVHLVHGTWGRGVAVHLLQALRRAVPVLPRATARERIWVDEGSSFRTAVEGSNRTFVTFEWSGSNSFSARRDAAIDFADHLRNAVARAPAAAHVIVAHSHGGNVAMLALRQVDEPTRRAVKRLVTMATPFLEDKGSAYPRIRRALVLGRLLALLLWIAFPALFWATGFLLPSLRGMITPPLGLALLWNSVVIIFAVSSFLLTTRRRPSRYAGVLAALVWMVALGLLPSETILAPFAIEASDEMRAWIPRLDAVGMTLCLAWFALAWRSTVVGAEALRDLVRVVLLAGLPAALVGWRLLLAEEPWHMFAWDAGAVALMPSFAAGTALSWLAVVWPPRRRSSDTPSFTVPLVALRLPRDEASFTIDTARMLERAGGVVYRWRWSAIPVAALTTLLSPLFFLQGFGLVASAAYGGWPAFLNIAGQLLEQPLSVQAIMGAMVAGAAMPVISLIATLPLCIGVGPEVLFGLSTRDVSCDELPVDGPEDMTLDVLPLAGTSEMSGLRHSAYNHAGIRGRVAAELASLHAGVREEEVTRRTPTGHSVA